MKQIFYKTVIKIRLNEIIIIISSVLSGRAQILSGFSPFGIACIGGLMSHEFSPWTSLLPILGYLLSGRSITILKYILACGVITGGAYKYKWFETRGIWGAFCAFSLFVSGIIYHIVFGLDYYSVIMLVIESILCGILVTPYDNFIKYFSGAKMRKTFTYQELLAISVVLFAALSSLNNIILPLDITLTGTVCSFVILFTALEFNVGICAITGTVLGILCGLSNPEMIYSVGSYSVAAIAASLTKRYKKIGVILSFILANAVMTLYVNGSQNILINIYEVILAGAILLFIPMKKLNNARNNIFLLLPKEKYNESTRMEALKKLTCGKLKKISDAFTSLSASIIRAEKVNKSTTAEDLDMIIESVAERVCKNCKNCIFCWGENFEATYEISENLIKVIEKRGWAEQYDLPMTFKNYCINISKFVLETNKVYELFRVNIIWKNKVSESRQLISQQLEGVSNVVDTLESDLKSSWNFETEMEREIISTLDFLGIGVNSVVIVNEKNNKLKIKLKLRNIKRIIGAENEIIKAVNSVVERKMVCTEWNSEDDVCFLEFKEDENFIAETGIARVRPKGERTWGDSFAIIRLDDGKIIAAISDGMGTGEEAARESNETVSLLEKLLIAGIDRSTAIKLINSVLILKSFEESFATLDMLVFDLYSGEGEFIKTGGVSSYIRKGNKIIEIQSGSLPTGIIGGVEAANYKTTLENGDIILIVSDGVTEVKRNDKWLKEALRETKKTSAQDIADSIIASACNGLTECEDDMTVLVIKISEK